MTVQKQKLGQNLIAEQMGDTGAHPEEPTGQPHTVVQLGPLYACALPAPDGTQCRAYITETDKNTGISPYTLRKWRDHLATAHGGSDTGFVPGPAPPSPVSWLWGSALLDNQPVTRRRVGNLRLRRFDAVERRVSPEALDTIPIAPAVQSELFYCPVTNQAMVRTLELEGALVGCVCGNGSHNPDLVQGMRLSRTTPWVLVTPAPNAPDPQSGAIGHDDTESEGPMDMQVEMSLAVSSAAVTGTQTSATVTQPTPAPERADPDQAWARMQAVAQDAAAAPGQQQQRSDASTMLESLALFVDQPEGLRVLSTDLTAAGAAVLVETDGMDLVRNACTDVVQQLSTALVDNPQNLDRLRAVSFQQQAKGWKAEQWTRWKSDVSRVCVLVVVMVLRQMAVSGARQVCGLSLKKPGRVLFSSDTSGRDLLSTLTAARTMHDVVRAALRHLVKEDPLGCAGADGAPLHVAGSSGAAVDGEANGMSRTQELHDREDDEEEEEEDCVTGNVVWSATLLVRTLHMIAAAGSHGGETPTAAWMHRHCRAMVKLFVLTGVDMLTERPSGEVLVHFNLLRAGASTRAQLAAAQQTAHRFSLSETPAVHRVVQVPRDIDGTEIWAEGKHRMLVSRSILEHAVRVGSMELRSQVRRLCGEESFAALATRLTAVVSMHTGQPLALAMADAEEGGSLGAVVAAMCMHAEQDAKAWVRVYNSAVALLLAMFLLSDGSPARLAALQRTKKISNHTGEGGVGLIPRAWVGVMQESVGPPSPLRLSAGHLQLMLRVYADKSSNFGGVCRLLHAGLALDGVLMMFVMPSVVLHLSTMPKDEERKLVTMAFATVGSSGVASARAVNSALAGVFETAQEDTYRRLPVLRSTTTSGMSVVHLRHALDHIAASGALSASKHTHPVIRALFSEAEFTQAADWSIACMLEEGVVASVVGVAGCARAGHGLAVSTTTYSTSQLEAATGFGPFPTRLMLLTHSLYMFYVRADSYLPELLFQGPEAAILESVPPASVSDAAAASVSDAAAAAVSVPQSGVSDAAAVTVDDVVGTRHGARGAPVHDTTLHDIQVDLNAPDELLMAGFPTWKSAGQQRAWTCLERGERISILSLPTAAGKTALVAMLGLKHPGSVTLLLAPTRHLAKELSLKLRGMCRSKGTVLEWQSMPKAELERAAARAVDAKNSVFVVATHAALAGFWDRNLWIAPERLFLWVQGLTGMAASGMVTLVVDEVHDVLGSAVSSLGNAQEWVTFMRLASRCQDLLAMGGRVVLMSGSLRSYPLQLFLTALKRHSHRILAEPVWRGDLKWRRVMVANDAAVSTFVVDRQPEDGVLLLFGNSKEQGRRIESVLRQDQRIHGVEYFDAASRDCDDELLPRVCGMTSGVVVCTIALSMGFNNPAVTVVGFLPGFRGSVDELIQCAGRVGRNGDGGTVWVCHEPNEVMNRGLQAALNGDLSLEMFLEPGREQVELEDGRCNSVIAEWRKRLEQKPFSGRDLRKEIDLWLSNDMCPVCGAAHWRDCRRETQGPGLLPVPEERVLTDCKVWDSFSKNGRCLKCNQPGHPATACPLKALSLGRGICVFDWLPNVVDDVRFHQFRGFTKEKMCRPVGQLIELILFVAGGVVEVRGDADVGKWAEILAAVDDGISLATGGKLAWERGLDVQKKLLHPVRVEHGHHLGVLCVLLHLLEFYNHD